MTDRPSHSYASFASSFIKMPSGRLIGDSDTIAEGAGKNGAAIGEEAEAHIDALVEAARP